MNIIKNKSKYQLFHVQYKSLKYSCSRK